MSLAQILQIGLPVLVQGVGEALKNVQHPAAQGAAAALDGLSDAINRGQITQEQIAEAHRHVEKMQEIEVDERKNSIQQINESLRAEVASADPYVRRMRPTFGYMIAVTWAAQMLALAYVIIFETESASMVIHSMDSLATIWGIGLSVLGVYMYKRSEEKKTFPQEPLPANKVETKSVLPPKAQPKYNP